MNPALREFATCLLAAALLVAATSVRTIPDATGSCTTDTDCMHQCIREGYNPDDCVDAGYEWAEGGAKGGTTTQNRSRDARRQASSPASRQASSLAKGSEERGDGGLPRASSR